MVKKPVRSVSYFRMKITRTLVAICCTSAAIFSSTREIIAAEPKSLAEVEEFAFGGVGVAGTESQGERFFREVMTHDDAMITFKKILSNEC